MGKNRSSHAVKVAAILMTLVLAAGTVTACVGKTDGRRTVNTDTTKQNDDDPTVVTGAETGNVTAMETDNTTAAETENTYNGSRRYATDYPIEIKEQKSDFFDDWGIWKRQENGVIFLQIQNSGFHGRETEIEYISFWVFDSAEEAEKAYEGHYNSSKEFDNGRFWEEGDNWFVSEEPGVMDASLVWMNYREDNVIIYAHLGTVSAYGKENDSDTSSGSGKFAPSALKNYILENASEIRSYVIDVIMEA